MKKQTFVIVYGLFFLFMMLLGSVYTYSIYRTELEQTLQISTTLSGIPYMVSLASFAVGMFVFGRLNEPHHTKKLSVLGGLLLTSAWMISAIASSIWVLMLSYGLMMGLAVGMLYGIPLMLIQKQDIPKKGLLSGVMLFAFGLSSVIFSPIARQVIDTYGLSTLFYVYAAVSFVVTFMLYLVLPTFHTEQNKRQALLIPPWGKYLFLLTSMSFVGLMMIGLTNVIATSNYALDPVTIATFISIFALLNAISRPIFGYLMDHFTFKKLALISIGLIIAASLVNVFNQGQSLILFFVGYGLYWFNLGVWLTMMPLYVKREVGTTLYAAVYGKVFLGYGISAVIGTLLSSLILDTLGDPRFLYMLIVGWMIIMSIYVVFGLNKKSA